MLQNFLIDSYLEITFRYLGIFTRHLYMLLNFSKIIQINMEKNFLNKSEKH